MKKRYIPLLIIVVLATSVIYLWNKNKEVSEEYDLVYFIQVSTELEFLTTTLMLNSIPDTFKLYRNEFTAKELSLFKNSLQNINLGLNVASVNMNKSEELDARDHKFSASIDELSLLFREIQENAETIDEDVFLKISEMSPDYSRKLGEVFYHSSDGENVFEKGSDVLEEMNQEIKEMLMQNDS